MRLLVLLLAILSIMGSVYGVGLIIGMWCIALIIYDEANSNKKKMSTFGKVMIIVALAGVALSIYFIAMYICGSKPEIREVSDVYKCSIQMPLYLKV